MAGNCMRHKNIIFLLLFALWVNTSYSSLPPGFSDLPTKEVFDVNVFYGKRFLATMVGSLDKGFFEFENPNLLRNYFSNFENKKILIQKLSKPLYAHLELACNKTNKRDCKIITPKDVGIILNKNKFKLHIYINPKYLKKAKLIKKEKIIGEKYEISYINSANIYGSFNRDFASLSTTMKNSIGNNKTSLNLLSNLENQLFYTNKGKSTIKYKVKDTNVTTYSNNYKYELGLINTNPSLFVPDIRIYGVGMNTYADNVVNLSSLFGTPIEVNILVPTNVTVRKDGMIIYSKFFEPGNFYLDTNSFPSGFYIVDVEKRDIYGNVITFSQIYIKNTTYLPPGTSSYGGFLGVNILTNNNILPGLGRYYISNFYYNARLSNLIQVGFNTIEYSNGLAYIDFIYSLFYGKFSFYSSLLAGSDKDIGIGSNIQYTYKSFLFSLTSRYLFPGNKEDNHVFNVIDNIRNENVIALSYNYRGWGFSANLSIDKDQGKSNEYLSFGAKKNFILFGENLRTSFNISDVNKNIIISLSLSLSFNCSNMRNDISTLGQRTSLGNSTKINYKAIYKTKNKQTYSFEASREKKNTSIGVGSSVHFYGINSNINFLYLFDDMGNKDYIGNIVLSLNNNIGLIATKDNIVYSSNIHAHSGVLIDIESPKNDHYEVEINKINYVVSGNKPTFISLKPFKKYNLTIGPGSEGGTYIQKNNISFTIYPNGVIPINMHAQEYYTLMGNFIYPGGQLVENAEIKKGLAFSRTDENGFGQVDIISGSKLILADKSQRECYVDTRSFSPENGFLYLDKIICHMLPQKLFEKATTEIIH